MRCAKCKKENNCKSGILKGMYARTVTIIIQQIKQQSGNWIRSFEAPVQDFRAKNPEKIVELEEIYIHWFKKILLDMECC
jgi:hypothetical protein